MIRRIQLTFLALFVSVWAMASETSVKNADGVEIWYDFDSNTNTASVTYREEGYYTYADEYTGNVVIPSKVTYEDEEYSVTSIGFCAFSYCSSLTSITLPESVTEIGEWTFADCSSLTSITIPENVTKIGSMAFGSCSSLTSITIPESVTEIGVAAFSGCYRLYEVYNKSNLTITAGSSDNGFVAYYAKNVYTDESGERKLHIVGDYIFYVDEDNIELLVYLGDETAITLPSDYEGKNYKIGEKAFSGCSSLTSITIPEGVTEIGNSAFNGCSSLTSITIPEGVTEIGESAFYGCGSLTSITIPEGVTEIGDYAFAFCSSLTSITLPKSVTEIENGAFSGCSSLTSITIQEGVTKIGEDAFNGCFKLYEVYNKSNLTITAGSSENGYVAYYAKAVYTDESEERKLKTVGDYIFYVDEDNIELLEYLGDETAITLPSNYEGKNYKIGNSAFSGCSSLTSITIPESVTSIGERAFRVCSSLTSITIPESVTSIGENAFEGCGSLTSITIPEGVTSIESGTFQGCGSLTSITIQEGVTEIGEKAFSFCSSLTSVTIPEGVTSIEGGTFQGCSSLTSITIQEGVTEIGWSAFEGCGSLTSITIPESVTSIGENAFSSCISLTSITMPKGVTEIGNSVFSGCRSLTSIMMPKGVTEIGDGAFDCCRSLTSITIPESVTSIGEYAFRDCSGLTNVTIGEGVTKIGDNAFVGCSNHDVYNRSKLYLTLGSEENGYVAYHANNVNNIYFETTDSYIFYVKEDDVELIKHIGGFDGADVMINEYVEDENIYSTDFSDGLSLNGWGGSATRTVVNEEMVLTNPVASDYWAVQFAYDHVEPFVAGRKYVISFKVKGSVAGTISAGLQNINGYTSAGEFGGIDVTTDWKEVRLTCTCTDGAATRLVFSVGTFVGDLYIDDFRFCSLFYKLSLPAKYKERVYDISRNAFEDDTYMTEIEIPEGVMAIGKDAMKGTALYEDESNWENGLLYVDGCLVAAKSSEVSELCVIEDGVRIIADNTFENITTLKNVIISADVRRIGNAAFNDCSGLTSITSMSTTPPEIGNKETFCNVDKSIPVYVPKQSVEAYKSAEYWKDFTNIVGKFVVVTTTAENGTVTGAGVYVENEEVTLIATPDEGYMFVKWEDGETNATRKITVTEDVTLTAVFESNSSVTPITDVVADSVSIRLIGNSLIVEGAESYAVYALSGQCLGKVESLERGVYIVVVDGVSKRIVVK